MQLFGSQVRCDAGIIELFGRNQTRERLAQHLATFAKCGSHQFENRTDRLGVGRFFVANETYQRRLDPWLRQKYRWRHLGDKLTRSPVGHLDRRYAVVRRTGAGDQTLGYLSLHHHQHRCHLGHEVENIENQRCRNVVREVRNHGPVVFGGCDLIPVDRERIMVHHGDGIVWELRFERFDQALVNFDRYDLAAGGDQTGGQRSQPRPDLDDMVARGDRGESHDSVDLIGIDKKVLPERFIGVQPESLE